MQNVNRWGPVRETDPLYTFCANRHFSYFTFKCSVCDLVCVNLACIILVFFSISEKFRIIFQGRVNVVISLATCNIFFCIRFPTNFEGKKVDMLKISILIHEKILIIRKSKTFVVNCIRFVYIIPLI